MAEDVRYYGQWMRDEAFKRIGHLYPPIEITPDMVAERPDLKPYEGQKLTVIAWLWARTVKSPNPAFSHVDVPLASTFIFSRKPGKEAYVHPVIEKDGYHFTVRVGEPTAEAKAAFFVTIVSFHEQIGGWQQYLARATSSEGVIRGYAKLETILRDRPPRCVWSPSPRRSSVCFAPIRTLP